MLIASLILLPVTAIFCFLLGAWVYHRAADGKSPLPPMPSLPSKAENDEFDAEESKVITPERVRL